MNFFVMGIPTVKYDAILEGRTHLLLCHAVQQAFDPATREPIQALQRIGVGDVVSLFADGREDAFGAQVVDVASYSDVGAHRFIQPDAVCILIDAMTEEQEKALYPELTSTHTAPEIPDGIVFDATRYGVN